MKLFIFDFNKSYRTKTAYINMWGDFYYANIIINILSGGILMQEIILTREEVMQALKIGRSTFYKLIHEGILKGFKEGNRYKVPSSSVKEYVSIRMEH